MKRQATPPLTSDQLEVMLLSVMPERNPRGMEGDGRLRPSRTRIAGLARFRVNAARDRKGPMAVFRVIPAKVVSVEQLGISKEVQQLCYLTKGLVLVTGPTGSGKSTTLCSLIDLIKPHPHGPHHHDRGPDRVRARDKKVRHHAASGGCAHRHLKRALRSALREDPDIVLVGEMRDLETIAIAIETAETGHLVFVRCTRRRPPPPSTA